MRMTALAFTAVALLAFAMPVSAAQMNVNGTNGWADGWGDATPNYATDTFLPGVAAYNGNAALVYDAIEGDPGRGVDQMLAAPITSGLVEISYQMYLPSTTTSASWFVTYYGTGGLSSWGGAYLHPSDLAAFNEIQCWDSEVKIPAGAFVADAWKEVKLALDLDNHKAEYFYDGVGYGQKDFTAINDLTGFGMPMKESYMGTPMGGPVYFDAFKVTQNGTEVWSENFAVPEPATMALLAMGGLTALLRRRR